MSINEPSNTHFRTAQHEAEDTELTGQNFVDESWKDWPNEAGFAGLEEHLGPIALQVKGSIPAWAAGALYRTGPGLNAIENTRLGTHHVTHWFDGFAHTHKFDICPPISDGGVTTVTYTSRRQSDDFVEHIKKKGWRDCPSFGQQADPCVGRFAKVMAWFAPSRVTNNVLVERNAPGLPTKAPAGAGARTGSNNMFLTTDNFQIQEIDPDTLEPIGFTNQKRLHPDLKGAFSSAHPQRDPESGDLFNYNLQPGPTAIYRIFRVNAATGTTDILATIKDAALSAAYIHSFFLTDNYVVLCIPTSHYSWKGIKILWDRQMLSAMKPFDKATKCQWLVVDRRHGKGVVARFSTPAAFFFHSINSFEEHVYEDGLKRTDICMDYVSYDSTDVMRSLYYDILLDKNGATKKFWLEEEAYLSTNTRLVRHRFRMPLAKQTSQDIAAATAEEVISIPGPHVGDLPAINSGYACKPYRYVYTAGIRGLATFVDSLVKTDLHTRDVLIWCGPKGHSPSEPIFVARPGATDEDDGVILTIVLDGSAQKSYLICLDSKTMTELGRAEADFPIAIGLHGIHAPAVEGADKAKI